MSHLQRNSQFKDIIQLMKVKLNPVHPMHLSKTVIYAHKFQSRDFQ